MIHSRHPVLPRLLSLFFLSGLLVSCSTPQAIAELPTVMLPASTFQSSESPTASLGESIKPMPSSQPSIPDQSSTETRSPVPGASIMVPYLLTPEQPLGGGTIQDGPFTFDVRLYRDPVFSANPVAPSLYSNLEGIGVYSVWEYHGPDLAGPVTVYWGIEPDVSALLSQENFDQERVQDGNSGGRSGGLILPGGSKVGDVVEAILKIEISQQTYGILLRFTLSEGPKGLEPVDISVRPLSTS